MRELYWQSWASIFAFIITLIFLWVPGPYAIGAFTFIAQPLFVTAFLGYCYEVYKDLRRSKVL